MTLKTKLTEEDFIKANLVLLYSKAPMILSTILILFFLALTIISAVVYSKVSIFLIILLPIMLIAMPIMNYFSAKRGYASDSRIGETIEYQFDSENLSMKGETFDEQLPLKEIYRVTKTKHFLLIWQNRQMANPIPERFISDIEIEELKNILSNKKVKNNL